MASESTNNGRWGVVRQKLGTPALQLSKRLGSNVSGHSTSSLLLALRNVRARQMQVIASVYLTVFSCCLYIANSYFLLPGPNRPGPVDGLPESLVVLEICVAVAFAMDYLFSTLAASNREAYLFGWLGLVDFLTSFPTLLFLYDPASVELQQAVQVVRSARVLKLYRVERALSTSMQKQAFMMMMDVFGFLFVMTALFASLTETKWLDALFITTMSVTTVGPLSGTNDRGNIVVSRGVLIVLVLVTWWLIPMHAQRLAAIVSVQSAHARRKYIARKDGEHVIVCGTISEGVVDFFAEMLHEDHRNSQALDIVVMARGPPPIALRTVQTDPKYAYRLHYLDGNVMDAKDLRRACAAEARAIFVLAPKFASKSELADHSTILMTMGIQRFIEQERDMYSALREAKSQRRWLDNVVPSVLTLPSKSSEDGDSENREKKDGALVKCVQLIRPEAKRLFFASVHPSSSGREDFSHVVSIDEIKMHLLAKTCLCPGFCTLVCNLVTSHGDPPESSIQWMQEYGVGTGLEIYRVPLAREYEGLTFIELAALIYQNSGLLLFALEINPPDVLPRVLLSPASLTLPNIAEYNLHGFVMAADKDEADILTQPAIDAAAKDSSDLKGGGTSHTLRMLSRRRSKDHAYRVTPALDSSTTDSNIDADAASSSKSNVRGGDHERVSSETRRLYAAVVRAHNKAGREVPQAVDPTKLNAVDAMAAAAAKFAQSTEGASLRPKKSVDRRRSNHASENADVIEPQSLGATAQFRLLKDAFVVFNELANLNDVTVPPDSTLSEAFPHVRDHIIVCGAIPHLFYFLLPLRSRLNVEQTPVVILHPTAPDERQWKEIAHFRDVYYFRGIANDASHLKAAGLKYAGRVVIFSPEVACHADSDGTSKGGDSTTATGGRKNGNDGSGSHVQSVVDADTIFTYRTVRRETVAMGYNVPIVCELTQKSNIELLHTNGELDEGKEDSLVEHHLRPAFAAGHVYSSSMIDTLLAQAYYNPHVITILRLLIAGVDLAFKKRWNERMLPRLGPVTESNLFEIAVPKKFVNKPYFVLFDSLVERQIIPLGVRRGILKKIGMGRGGNKLPFVFTNPPRESLMYECDTLFCLAIEAPEGAAKEKHRRKMTSQDFREILVKAREIKEEKEGKTVKSHVRGGLGPLGPNELSIEDEKAVEALQATIDQLTGDAKANLTLLRAVLAKVEAKAGSSVKLTKPSQDKSNAGSVGEPYDDTALTVDNLDNLFHTVGYVSESVGNGNG